MSGQNSSQVCQLAIPAAGGRTSRTEALSWCTPLFVHHLLRVWSHRLCLAPILRQYCLALTELLLVSRQVLKFEAGKSGKAIEHTKTKTDCRHCSFRCSRTITDVHHHSSESSRQPHDFKIPALFLRLENVGPMDCSWGLASQGGQTPHDEPEFRKLSSEGCNLVSARAMKRHGLPDG